MDKTRVPVAVIGLACRLPGGINSPDQLWQALLRGEDFVTEVPLDRWDVEEYYDPEPGVPGRSHCKWGAFVDNIGDFDPEFFAIAEKEAVAMDPQHRMLLETSWEAMEHAGMTPAQLTDTPTGVFIGLNHGDYQFVQAETGTLEGPYGNTGTNSCMASGRVSYALGLRGPSVTVDTACSSGLFAAHLAFRSINDGESDLAFTGGVYAMLEPRRFASGSANGMLSRSGRCHAFDVEADGFVSGEGAVVLLLKRLDHAERDGDRILAVIRGTSANQDGHTVNIVTPSVDAQEAVYRTALDAADIDPDTVGMVEAHGTGTPVGDPVEFESLAAVYGTNGPCALGSVKTNFGHTQSTAGALGLMKAVLAVQHGVVPQNLHFNEMPEKIAAIKSNLFVPQEVTPWPISDPGQPRRAAVSSYGMSGTNVHAVLEQAPAQAPVGLTVLPDGSTGLEGTLIFPVSASSEEALRKTAGQLADWVDAQGADLQLSDLAYTLARRRSHRPVRTAVLAGTAAELRDALREVADGETPYPPAAGQDKLGPVWVFSGQGSQWAEMGKDLLANEPVFAAKIAEIEPLISAESGFSVTEALTAPEKVTGIDRVQPTIFAMQVALAATMQDYGVTPGAVIGHSLGESAASVVAGALSLEDGVKVICRRSKLMTRIAGAGAMASVELPAQQVLSELMARGVNDAVVAVVASPQSTVIGGATQTVRELVAAWEERDVMAREVAVDVASHSPQVDPILDDLTEALEDITALEPQVPYYSATSFDPREEPYCDAYYWADNLRHTVRFAAAVQAALEDGFRVFTELSPHPLLTHAVDQTARSLDMTAAALAAMRREQPLPHGLRGLVGDLYAAGAAVDFAVLYPGGRLLDATLPAWTHRRLMLLESTDRLAHTHAVAVHPLLGAHVRLPEEPERHVWQSDIGTEALPWLADHQIHGAAALPGAAYCEMALTAARTVLGEAAEVRDVKFEQLLLLDEETYVGATATVEAPGVVPFTVETTQGGERARRASAVLHALNDEEAADLPAPRDMDALLAAHQDAIAGDDLRLEADLRGIQFGPAFGGLASAYTAEAADTVLAEVGLPGSIRSQQGGYGIHPALLDACFQSVAAHPSVRNVGNGGLLLPLGVNRIRSYGPARNAHYCLTTVTPDGTGVTADIDVLDEHGALLLAVRGLQMGTGVSQTSERDRVLGERLLAIEWQQHELPEKTVTEPGNWLLISTAEATDMVATQLTDALKMHDAQSTTMSWPLHGDHDAAAARLRAQFESGSFSGLVVLTERQVSTDEDSIVRSQEYVKLAVRIARELPELVGQSPRLYVVTRNAQTVLADDCPNLEQGGLRGLLRVIGAEHPHLKVSYVDVDDQSSTENVARQLLLATDEDETAWRDDQWYTARLYPTPLRPEERRNTVVDHQEGGMRLQVRVPGDLQTMEFTAFDRVAPGPNEIEVAVSAASINFADVLAAYGRCPTFDGKQPPLGLDFAGVVTAVGSDVTDHKVGDHVGGLSPDGCWSTFVTCDAGLAATLPTGLTDAQAAAVTTASATAWYGLQDLARIRSGDKVLIHSGTGGVGQAAIAIARAAGAEIFATAGSEKRRQILRDMGIEHVYDSRSTEFAEQIRNDTDGYGVDIVLNSVTGAAQLAGIRLLAMGGRFVEIGKLDIYQDTKVGLFPFRQNLAFFGVDLALMSRTHPAQVRGLLQKVYEQTANGVLPMPEATHYPLAEAATAVRIMGAAEHTGKLILDVPHAGRSSVVLPPEQAQVFRGDSSYIITGGLGGLGLFLAEKIAGAGAGRIVLSSRSQPSQKALETIEMVRSIGADVVVECGDIAEPGTAQRLVSAATATGLPLRGVLHGAAVVEDATLPNITEELIERDWAPKVRGAWRLHEATEGHDLDWFCSFSSAAALAGSPGQGAYAAANSWLDAFTLWRRAQGLPATSIAWGAWAEIGRGTDFAETSGDAIEPEEGAYAFEALLRHNRPYTGYAPVIGSAWLTAFAQRTPFAEAFKSAGKGRSGGSKFLAELAELDREEWPARLRRMISEQVGLILRRSVDVDRPISEFGMDSLGNLELRTHIESEVKIRVTTTDITTVRGLADHLYEQLTSKGDAATPV
ncbi:sulfolipid-1 biosynthesis phthioceranic/hydroxyphthioceranic acid synthase [Mycobacterium paragordonae]|uniref:Sulfolipid-1 biosynthesis phthioceranic/hydroxyphthioceranic acid synthase n=1 Tax=Mycobacterium paragordonae TaxID=1389713 RepID=A0A4R5WS11_9MYCO|nr:type I polyketide synthase [Mycobacterium paragordonae]MDP7735339.1 sulfolipid-1 biosynthesis phthioceranic/hydroxyphthioceranic acid synthase [Mycobacterium paragordonae]TDK93455.1 SDR family NAD(P)-dependent oxidoreductase [Mycobacterium paragordonae]TDL04899.1 SDR family NAD(P)-dependent oxidoreductase [Mycobacterium paragordonae]